MSSEELSRILGDELDEIERPRLEDSRGSPLLHLPHDQQQPPYDLLMMMLPQCRARDPLLSSTMMQESSLDQDWPTASSIGLVNNSRESVGISQRLNNADICLEVSTETDVSDLLSASSSSSDCAVAIDVPAPGAPADPDREATSAATADDSIASISASDSDASNPESSPRLRVLASAATADFSGSGSGSGSDDCVDGQHPREHQPMQRHHHEDQHHSQQQTLGLLQVCRLTLDVLSEGGLLCEDARRWLSPELLCDKLCERLHGCPQPPAAPPAAAAAAADSSVAAIDFESPSGRVRQWLLAGGDGGALSGSPLRRHVTNSV